MEPADGEAVIFALPPSIRQLPGHFEIHLTLEARDSGVVDQWATAKGYKFVQIVLDRGTSPIQPMLTWQVQDKSLDLAEQDALAVSRAISAELGVRCTRIKIEAAPWWPKSPADVHEELATAGCYFEHHIKLLLHRSADCGPLIALARRNHARLSQNVRRIRPDQRLERFVTQRCHQATLAEAEERLNLLVAELRTANWEILEVEAELVIVDSNLSLDDGWLTEGKS